MAKLFTLKAESKLQQPATGPFKIKTQLCRTVAGGQNKTVFPEPLGFSIRLPSVASCRFRRLHSTLYYVDGNNPRLSRTAFCEKESGAEGSSVSNTLTRVVAVDDAAPSEEHPTGGWS